VANPPRRPSLDSVTTIEDDGSRPFIYPADTHGRFTQARRWSACALIAFYLSLPWIKLNGYPAVFLDVAERRFHLFGITGAAQDLWLMFFIITGLGFSLFFLTALLGRVWCGWACPHTVFLDHVYRRIERLIEGDALRRRALAAAPLSVGKILKIGLKHTLYVLLSAVITHLLLAYFVSVPEVWLMIRAAPTEHGSAFGFIAVATGALYFNFAWFREQLCIVVCPYGRIQSALIDDNSLVVGYDAKRGEPRGKLGAASAGDCVACSRCVQVCPTGIDIRQGLQMECVGCTACIDACDDVKTRLKRPSGLIRYDSQNGFAGKPTRWFRPRVALYGVLLAVGAGVALWAVSTIRPANLAVTRIIGTPYFVTDDFVRNQFLVRVVNKRNQTQRYLVSVNRAPASLVQNGLTAVLEVPALGEIVQPLVLQMPRREFTGAFGLEIRLADVGGHFHLERDVEFLGPDPRLRPEKEEEKNERGKKH
jgi:cytochrome c oxidase accessory protein FixG